MLKLRKIAVTGSLSCGKSSVCRIFQQLGAHTVSADDIVHKLLSPNTSIGQKVIALLGQDIVVDGRIDRSAVAKKVFNDQNLLYSLQEILHPAVFDEIEKQYQELNRRGNNTLFVAEIPLLFECQAENRFDATIAVAANSKICHERFKASTGYASDEYDKRMTHQLSSEEKTRRANYVIENNGNPQDLYDAVIALYKTLINPR